MGQYRERKQAYILIRRCSECKRKDQLIFGVPIIRDLSYIFDETFDYTGKLTVGKGFITKHYPDDDKVRPCPFSPDAYNNVFELEHGRIIGIKMIKGTAEECR